MKIILIAAILLATVLNGAQSQPIRERKKNNGNKAVAVIQPTNEQRASGKVEFTQGEGFVLVKGEVRGLVPGSRHGFHIHEHGDCSSPDASSAGEHFNPANAPHGAPDAAMRHAGDLGNITADSSGLARFERKDTVIKLSGPDSIVGRSIMVHENPDDLTSQPTGNSGARIGCGVIR